MLTAKEIMVTDVVTTPPDSTIGEAADIMLQNRISGMPVTSDDQKLLGIITEYALMVISFYPEADRNPVSDHMTPSVVTVTENMELKAIADLMITQRLRRVPVVRDNRLVGSISRRDVLRAVREEARAKLTAASN